MNHGRSAPLLPLMAKNPSGLRLSRWVVLSTNDQWTILNLTVPLNPQSSGPLHLKSKVDWLTPGHPG